MENNWFTYRNEKFGFTVQYPPNSKIVENYSTGEKPNIIQFYDLNITLEIESNKGKPDPSSCAENNKGKRPIDYAWMAHPIEEENGEIRVVTLISFCNEQYSFLFKGSFKEDDQTNENLQLLTLIAATFRFDE